MKRYLFFVFTLLAVFSFGQTFTDGDSHDIDEDGNFHCNAITVTGVGTISDVHGLEKVCMIISDDYDGDLLIYLVAPDGTTIELSTNNGGDGDDYGSSGWSKKYTCFTMTASTPITSGSAPFEGDFIPESDLSLVNNFQDADGNWNLCLKDDNPNNGTSITLEEWSLTFSDNVVANAITRITTCDDDWYDLGGASGDYSPGEYHFWVICSDDTTKDLAIKFDQWDVEDSTNDDRLLIWNDSVAAGNVYEVGDGLNSLGNTIVRSNNPSGCLTLRWVSDTDSVVGSGWTAHIECYVECQEVQFQWLGSIPATDSIDTNYIKVCRNIPITFNAKGIYPENDHKYHQSDASSTFKWYFDDSTSAEGMTVTHQYHPDRFGRGYNVELVVIDTMGCRSRLELGKRVEISIPPTFTGTKPEDNPICANTCTTLDGINQNYSWHTTIPPTFSDTVKLPDGSGNYYYSNIKFNAFRPGDTISDVSQIDSICTSFEHSWVGDLIVWIVCPNGTEVLLFDGNDADDDLDGDGYKNKVSYYLGIPQSDDGSDEGPGVGWTYCFKNGPSQLLTDGPTQHVTTGDGDDDQESILGGTYKPKGNLSDLVGCPLNGTWSIKTEDDQSADDGYIFAWNIWFDSSLYDNNWGYTMRIDSVRWYGEGLSDSTVRYPQACPEHVGTESYRFEVIDNFGCHYDTTITLTTRGVEIDLTSTDEYCSTGGGTLTATVLKGNADYTYHWSNSVDEGPTSNTTSTQTGVAPGTYYITVTDADNCEDTAHVKIIDHPGPTITISSKKDVTCYGYKNGEATVSISGGEAPYTITWSGGESATELRDTGLSGGWYYVTVKDVNDCEAVDSVEIHEPPEFSVSVNNFLLKCHGDKNAKFYATITGGTSPYTYQWNDALLTTTDSLVNQGAGTYIVVVTDNNHCEATDTGVATEPSPIILTADTTSSNCNHNDGAIDLSVSGGTPGYTYQWNDSANSTTEDLTNIYAGTYSVTVEDSKHCRTDTTIKVDDAGSPTAVISSTTNVKCYGEHTGVATVSISDGEAPFSFKWTSGDTTQTAANLPAGDYTVTVTDKKGCKATASTTITEPPYLNFHLKTIDNKCNGECKGIATVTPFGGTPPYTYQWTGGGDNPNDSSNTGLCAGTYSIVITDSNQCDTTYNNVVINEPTALSLTVSWVNVKCYGQHTGSATVHPSGGTPPYTYLWSLNTGSQTTQSISNLAAGTYSVTVTDSNDCQQSISVTITEPDELKFVNVSHHDVSCYQEKDGNITSGAQGGSGNYVFYWENDYDPTWDTTAQDLNNIQAGTYYLTVTDDSACTIDTAIIVTMPDPIVITHTFSDEKCAGACDGSIQTSVTGGSVVAGNYTYQWSNGETTGNIDDLCPGEYRLTVSDTNHCEAYDTVVISGPAPLVISVDEVVKASCSDSNGSITISVTGGTPPVTAHWNNGEDGFKDTALVAGSYRVIVTDSNSCQADTIVNVGNIDGPIITGIDEYDVKCHGGNDGALKVNYTTPSNPALPYSIKWSIGDTTDSISHLTAGNYRVTITDTNNCAAVSSGTVHEPSEIMLITNTTDATCYHTCNGSAVVSAIGGTPGYTYQWSNGQTNDTATSLCAQTYTVTVTDTNGCKKSTSVTIDEPDALTITLVQAIDVSCPGNNDGSITISAGGGSGVYNYAWSTGTSTTSTISDLDSGTYFVTVSDQNDPQCKIDSNFSISQPEPIVVTVGSQPITCNESNGKVFITSLSGGTAPYHWNWSPCSSGCGDDTLSNVNEGVYQLQVFDDNNCSVIVQDTVGHIDVVKIDSIIVTNVKCHGGNDGTATVFTNGIAKPHTYTWSPYGSSDSVTTNLIADNYTVTVTDSNGCTSVRPFKIEEPPALKVILDGPETPLCIGQYTTLSATASGGTPDYTYHWSDTSVHGQVVSIAPTASTTAFSVYAVDANGCVSPTSSITVTLYPPLSVVIASPEDICEGETVTLTATAHGGNNNYSYVWNTQTGNPITEQPVTTTNYWVSVYDDCGTPPAGDTTTVVVHQAPKLLSINGAEGCEPLTVTFTPAIYSPDSGTTYSWLFYDQVGSGTDSKDSMPTHTYQNDGIYDVGLVLTSKYGCKSDTTIKELVKVYPVPNASFTMDPQAAGVFDSEIQFFDNSEPNIAQWYWAFGDSSYSMIKNPIHTYTHDGIYEVTLVVGTDHYCYDTATVLMRIKPEHTFYAPSAFSPGTGYSNNYWYPKGIGVDSTQFHMWIYDRWGQIIYDSDVIPAGFGKVVETEGGWNGRYQNVGLPVPPDTYVWLVRLVDVNGEKHQYSGTVTVVK